MVKKQRDIMFNMGHDKPDEVDLYKIRVQNIELWQRKKMDEAGALVMKFLDKSDALRIEIERSIREIVDEAKRLRGKVLRPLPADELMEELDAALQFADLEASLQPVEGVDQPMPGDHLDDGLARLQSPEPGQPMVQPVEPGEPHQKTMQPVEPEAPNQNTVPPVQLEMTNQNTVQPVEPEEPNQNTVQPVQLDTTNQNTVQPVEPEEPNQNTVPPVQPETTNQNTVQPVQLQMTNQKRVQLVEPEKPAPQAPELASATPAVQVKLPCSPTQDLSQQFQPPPPLLEASLSTAAVATVARAMERKDTVQLDADMAEHADDAVVMEDGTVMFNGPNGRFETLKEREQRLKHNIKMKFNRSLDSPCLRSFLVTG